MAIRILYEILSLSGAFPKRRVAGFGIRRKEKSLEHFV
jgi:hypothetical protein